MSRGKNLQEMESDTKQSRTAVNAGAKPAEPMPKLTTGIPDGQTGSWEDLGGPTPENYRSDDDSSKLKDPSTTLKQVKDVVTKGAKAAEAMKKMASPVKESSEEDEDEELVEGEYEEDEVVAEAKHKSEEDEEGEEEEDEEGEEEEEDEEDEKEKAMKEAFAEIEEEKRWDQSFKQTKNNIVAAAQKAKEEIAAGLSAPMDYEQL